MPADFGVLPPVLLPPMVHLQISAKTPGSVGAPSEVADGARSPRTRKNSHILHGDQTDVRQIFTRPTTNANARSVCGS